MSTMFKHDTAYHPHTGQSRYLYACACHWSCWSEAERRVHYDSWDSSDRALFGFFWRWTGLLNITWARGSAALRPLSSSG